MRFGAAARPGRYRRLDTENTSKTPEAPEKPENPEAPESQDNQEIPETAENRETAEKPEKPENQETPEKSAEPDWKDLYARLLADFDNFKKRTARDRDDIYRYAEAEILKDILPAVDNLSLALASAKDPEDPFVKGVSMTMDSFLAALKGHGAEPFDSVGKPLDTDKMDAVAQLPNDDVEEGVVSNEVKKGWMLKGRVLRAAQVVVSAGKRESGS